MELLAAHCPDEHLIGSEHPCELAEIGAASVEIRAQRKQDRRRALRIARVTEERVDERRALALVAANGEQFLELIDRDHGPFAVEGIRCGAECVDRMLAGPD